MKITIITVVKNDKKNLLISLKSVLAQNLKNFEYIIYDGMSNDGTRYAVKRYLNKNIKYICRKDKNYYEGLNYAINKASGDYIGILNAGDKYCNNNILKKIFKLFCLYKFEVIFGNLIYVDEENKNLRFWNFHIKKLNHISAIKIASPTIFVKKKIVKKYPYNTMFSISADTDFNLRFFQNKKKFFYLNENVIFMKIGGLSTNFKFFFTKFKEDLIILKKYFKITFVLIYFYIILINLKLSI